MLRARASRARQPRQPPLMVWAQTYLAHAERGVVLRQNAFDRGLAATLQGRLLMLCVSAARVCAWHTAVSHHSISNARVPYIIARTRARSGGGLCRSPAPPARRPASRPAYDVVRRARPPLKCMALLRNRPSRREGREQREREQQHAANKGGQGSAWRGAPFARAAPPSVAVVVAVAASSSSSLPPCGRRGFRKPPEQNSP